MFFWSRVRNLPIPPTIFFLLCLLMRVRAYTHTRTHTYTASCFTIGRHRFCISLGQRRSENRDVAALYKQSWYARSVVLAPGKFLIFKRTDYSRVSIAYCGCINTYCINELQRVWRYASNETGNCFICIASTHFRGTQFPTHTNRSSL